MGDTSRSPIAHGAPGKRPRGQECPRPFPRPLPAHRHHTGGSGWGFLRQRLGVVPVCWRNQREK
jgi:hypothetical protein